MSTLPLRIKFSLAVSGILGSVLGALWLLGQQEDARESGAIIWFGLSGIVLATLLVDRAADRLVYRRLAQLRQTMLRAAAGETGVRTAVDPLDEIGVVARGLNEILRAIELVTESVDIRVAAATETFRQRSEALADSHREMAMLSEELARAGRLAALGQAAANMAHQIGTPLNLISGYVQLLIHASALDSAMLGRLKAIQEQVAKVTAVVRSTLDSSRPPTLRHEPTDLGELARRVCQMAGPMLEEAGVRAETLLPNGPAPVLADPVQLELALLNLVTNSVDAMVSGGTLTLRVERQEQRLLLVVEDTGSGIAPELLAHVFDPWVTTKAPGRGSGLGLSIARQVVASHGGTIRVGNRPDSGAVFTIELPAYASPGSASGHVENSDR